jgi:hypothetical protein
MLVGSPPRTVCDENDKKHAQDQQSYSILLHSHASRRGPVEGPVQREKVVGRRVGDGLRISRGLRVSILESVGARPGGMAGAGFLPYGMLRLQCSLHQLRHQMGTSDSGRFHVCHRHYKHPCPGAYKISEGA